MADTNGLLKKVQELRAQVEEQQARSEESLLADMADTHPHLRRLLLGRDIVEGTAIATSLSFRKSPFSIRSIVTVPDLGYIAQEESKSLYSLLEMWDNHLANGTMPYQEDFEQVRKLRQKLRV